MTLSTKLTKALAFWVAVAPMQSAWADPCGMVPPAYLTGKPIQRIGLQKTYVFFKNGMETFVIRPGFTGRADQFGRRLGRLGRRGRPLGGLGRRSRCRRLGGSLGRCWENRCFGRDARHGRDAGWDDDRWPFASLGDGELGDVA